MKQETGIDTTVLDELAATTDAEFVGELIDAFCEETPRYIGLMKKALIEQDAESFRRAAHTIKSTSATLGALTLAEEARELENLGRENRLEGVDIRVDQFSDSYQETSRAMEAWRNG